MAETVNTYWAKFGVDSSDFVGGIGKAQSSFLSFYSAVSISAFSTIEIFGKLTSAVKEFGNMADEIRDLSYQTGISTQKIQQFQYATVLAGEDASTLTNSLNTLTRAMETANDSTSEAAAAFRELGVHTDGRTVDQVFEDTARALFAIEDETRRNTLAFDIYGRSSKDVLLIQQSLVENNKKIKEHPTISDEDLKRLEEGKVLVDDLAYSVKGYLGIAIATAMKDPIGALFKSSWGWVDALKGEKAGSDVMGGADFTIAQFNDKIPTDRFAGLTDAEIELRDAEEELSKAIIRRNDAFKKGDLDKYDLESRSIQRLTNHIANLKKAREEEAAAAARSASVNKSGWGNESIVGSVGSEMYEYLMAEQEMGTDYQTAMQKWSQNALHKTPAQAGSLGAAKESGAATASKAKKIEDENKKISDATKAGYVELEKLTLIHETAEAEMSRVKYQALLDYAAEAVNWAGSHPIIQKSAILTKNGYDIDISPLAAVTAPRLAAADFSSVRLTGGAVGGGGGGTTNNTNINLYVTTKDNPKAIANTIDQAQAQKRALGGTI